MAASELAELGVRFKSSTRVDSEALKEVAARSCRPYTIFAHVFSALIVCFGLFWYLNGGQIVVLIGLCVAAIMIEIEQYVVTQRNSRLLVEREMEMQRLLPDTFLPVRETAFTDGAIVSLNTGTSYEYQQITKVMQSEHYVILVQRGGIFTLVSKENLQGGTVDEFVSFIEAKCG